MSRILGSESNKNDVKCSTLWNCGHYGCKHGMGFSSAFPGLFVGSLSGGVGRSWRRFAPVPEVHCLSERRREGGMKRTGTVQGYVVTCAKGPVAVLWNWRGGGVNGLDKWALKMMLRRLSRPNPQAVGRSRCWVVGRSGAGSPGPGKVSSKEEDQTVGQMMEARPQVPGSCRSDPVNQVFD